MNRKLFDALAPPIKGGMRKTHQFEKALESIPNFVFLSCATKVQKHFSKILTLILLILNDTVF